MNYPRFNMPDPRQPLKWPQALTAHRGWLSAVIFARVRDRDAVDEILQETALAAVTGNCPSDDTGVSRWLYRVAVRQSVLYRRKRGRNEKKTNGYSDLAISRSSEQQRSQNPLAILLATEQASQVREAMTRLSNADNEVLLLKYSENWSCREMAERLGVSSSAIKSRLMRARGNLRHELVRTSEFSDD